VANTCYSLFIDESGSFDSQPAGKQDKRWIVAGVLCGCDASTAVKHFASALLPLTRQYGEAYGLMSKEDFHLSVLRSKLTQRYKDHLNTSEDCPANYERLAAHRASLGVAEVAKAAFDAISIQSFPVRFAAVVNERWTGVEGGKKGDWNYRLMMLDLLALVETILPEQEQPTHLDLIIATRSVKINGKSVFMSKYGDIQLTIEDLQPSFEAGLATRGLIEIQQNYGLKLELVGATDVAHPMSWGLIAADFVANTTYNRDTSNLGQLYNDLCASGRLRTFEGRGAYNERRARVAERDGDYITALHWWASVKTKPSKKQDTANYFVHLFEQALKQTGARSAQATIDSLIERFWQDGVRHGDYAELYRQLGRSENALEEVTYLCSIDRVQAPLFRLRNFMLTIANHRGDSAESNRLIELQGDMRTELSVSPEHLSLILDFDLYSIEAMVNKLEFEQALAQALKYHALVDRYKECWCVMNDYLFTEQEEAATTGFHSTRIYVRAESTLLRTLLLTPLSWIDTTEPCIHINTVDIVDRLEALEHISLHKDDRSRVRNYRIQAYLKLEMYDHALNIGLESLTHGPNAFDIFWSARAACDALLFDHTAFHLQSRHLLSWLREHEAKAIECRNDHPYELIWREHGLLEYLLEHDLDRAEYCCQRSLQEGASDAPIHIWLRAVVDIQLSFIRSESPRDAMSLLPKAPSACYRLTSLASTLDDSKSLLQRVRAVSPY